MTCLPVHRRRFEPKLHIAVGDQGPVEWRIGFISRETQRIKKDECKTKNKSHPHVLRGRSYSSWLALLLKTVYRLSHQSIRSTTHRLNQSNQSPLQVRRAVGIVARPLKHGVGVPVVGNIVIAVTVRVGAQVRVVGPKQTCLLDVSRCVM